MDKDYDNWNDGKKKISLNDRVYFRKGDIWFASIGKNIGDEEDGKNYIFERPILIIRKFNNNIFLGIPLTSQDKEGKYYYKLDYPNNSVAILSQIRLFDAKRLLRFIRRISSKEVAEIKSKMNEII
jgi:mRNA-degrading endonuclease toxin of MazEF toxin-antitoxin module